MVGFILKFDDKLKLIKNAGFDTICTWWGNEFDLTDGKLSESSRNCR
jgi:nitrite reductase/ring-hydroxylating ferredoxin subunit